MTLYRSCADCGGNGHRIEHGLRERCRACRGLRVVPLDPAALRETIRDAAKGCFTYRHFERLRPGDCKPMFDDLADAVLAAIEAEGKP